VRPLVLKFGGELLEDRAHLANVVSAVARIAIGEGDVAGDDGPHAPLIIVHGGGREIDAALKNAGLDKRQIDGLRITDDATLDVVVSVLGAVNTRFVAALNTAAVPAVGLTGADANCGLSVVAPRHRAADGQLVDLGRVGVPAEDADMRLLESLVGDRFVPVLACVGIARDGTLLNVNADTLAGHLAARLSAKRLVIAGTTPGVLGPDGATLPLLESTAFAQLVSSGTATAGMIAKLRACDHALAGGVEDVVIVDGRDGAALIAAATSGTPPRATRLIATAGLKACTTEA
jgi:acetylglutamate kinase